jgi:hypothetical protein
MSARRHPLELQYPLRQRRNVYSIHSAATPRNCNLLSFFPATTLLLLILLLLLLVLLLFLFILLLVHLLNPPHHRFCCCSPRRVREDAVACYALRLHAAPPQAMIEGKRQDNERQRQQRAKSAMATVSKHQSSYLYATCEVRHGDGFKAPKFPSIGVPFSSQKKCL